MSDSGFDLVLRITAPVYEVPWKISETIVISGNKDYKQKTFKYLSLISKKKKKSGIIQWHQILLFFYKDYKKD